MKHHDFARNLGGHLSREFNIQSWKGSYVNDAKLVLWTSYNAVAVREGPDGMKARAERDLAGMKKLPDSPNDVINEIRDSYKEMAKATIKFCNGLSS